MESSVRISNCINPCPRILQALPWRSITSLSVMNCKKRISFWCCQTGVYYYETKRKSFAAYANSEPEPGDPLPSTPPLPPSNPMVWILGFMALLALPFCANKWGPIKGFKDRLKNAVETVENTAEGVEGFANIVDKIVENIVHDLPQGKLRDLVESIEHTAEITAKAAHCLNNVVDKVQEVEDQVESILETAIKGTKGPPNEKTA